MRRRSLLRFALDVGEAGIMFGSSDSSQNCTVTSSDSGGSTIGTGTNVPIVDKSVIVFVAFVV